MRVEAFFLISIWSCCFALPSPINWDQIRANNAYVKTVGNASLPVLPRVIGGEEVTPNSRPFQVALIIDGSHFCGGSLISRTFILTAAHCIEGKAYFQIILGAHNIREVEPTQVVVTSTNSIVHPRYNPVNLNNDIGLIRMPNPIVVNNNIQTIALAPSNSGSFLYDKATLSGWGRLSDSSSSIASTLHLAYLDVTDNLYCSRSYGSEVVIESTICTDGVGLFHVVGGCDGDSGSPLVIDDMQIGVVSFIANSGCERGLPTGYARVSSYTDWIVQNSDLE
ncbi:hypothetical protein NQ315_011557 [Exocentrus adspersus]|uniref:Peptidase S1 domain-containing protein n=1 Tax=Exocentrus adspersus TaxID=1586481 RepID=A0AAV8VVB0_9CUCU|nr:hypothetical protein NQ315_011557 [Exocentrus adspersus]